MAICKSRGKPLRAPEEKEKQIPASAQYAKPQPFSREGLRSMQIPIHRSGGCRPNIGHQNTVVTRQHPLDPNRAAGKPCVSALLGT